MEALYRVLVYHKLPLAEAYLKNLSKAIHLKVDSQRKTGVLSTMRRVITVRIMKINTKGDALVHDGKTVLMVPAKHVYAQDMEETFGPKRLMLAKRAFTTLSKGDLREVMKIYTELIPLVI